MGLILVFWVCECGFGFGFDFDFNFDLAFAFGDDVGLVGFWVLGFGFWVIGWFDLLCVCHLGTEPQTTFCSRYLRSICFPIQSTMDTREHSIVGKARPLTQPLILGSLFPQLVLGE